MKVARQNLALALGMLLAFTVTAMPPSPKAKSKKYYQVVMIWLKDPQKFHQYGEQMGPIVSKYGGGGERIITPVSTFYGGNTGKDLSAPDMVNIVFYDSKEAYEDFENDPAFQRIKSLRSESIKMAGIGGEVLDGELMQGNVENRLYMIEFTYYQDDNPSAYKQYERQARAYFKKHGVRKERVLKPDAVFGGIEMPHQVTIKYLDDASNKAAMEADPQHKEIEDLYGAAIRDLIWIEGKAAFVNMD